MLTLSLDTNCVIALEEVRADPMSHRVAEAREVETIVNAHAPGKVNVAVIAISASERQKDNVHLENFSIFQERLVSLGLEHLDLLHPMMYFDVTFWDASLCSDDAMQALERAIHEILFPNIPFLWSDYCAANGLDPSSETPVENGKMRNAMYKPSGVMRGTSAMCSLLLMANFIKSQKSKDSSHLLAGTLKRQPQQCHYWA